MSDANPSPAGRQHQSEPTSLPEFLREIYRTGLVFGPDGAAIELRWAVRENEAEALYRTVRRIQPRLALEVGLGQGVSTLAILAAMEDNGCGEHHVADPTQNRFDNIGVAMVERAGLSHRFVFHRDYAEPVIQQLGQLDFVFIDASHKFDLTLSAFAAADLKLRVGGVMGFHDLWLPSQQAAIRFILNNRHYVRHEPEASGPRRPTPLWRRLLRRLPLADRGFRQDLLHPWRELRLENLGFLEKTAEDDRDFNHFVVF